MRAAVAEPHEGKPLIILARTSPFHAMPALEERFPGMKEKYLETFGQGNELVSPAKEELTKLIHRTCGNYHIEDDAGRIFTWLHAFVDREAGEQMSLFDLQGTDWGQ